MRKESIAILIPTRGRLSKLLDTVNSIHFPSHIITEHSGTVELDVQLCIVVDGDVETYNVLKQRRYELPACVFYTSEHVGSVRARNQALTQISGSVLNATDDILFGKDTISSSLELLLRMFPDTDGVVGIKQNFDHHPAGVHLIGRAFRERYPYKVSFCPEYYHFACQEVHWLASTLHRFAYLTEPNAIIQHKSPFSDKSLMDETHEEARKFRVRDHQMIERRQKGNVIWGLDTDNDLADQATTYQIRLSGLSMDRTIIQPKSE